ncbi:hypothetical protein [Flavobacterium aquicola]|uniref:Uncharacterized protein n=1 Tax=Flavobacterium aquicola TaxID=1682742 RepID=A0A3E0ET62_9FLAO|nr:hypothetical protein [Flavobacterium aquicola]REH00851.1 hypothetical protein C8P67_102100 [Flavobacterium aquicola]
MNTRESFNYFTSQTGIQIPQNVLNIYSNGDTDNSEFIRLFKPQIDSIKKGYNPELRVLISENFAKEILTLIHEYSYEERITTLYKEIFNNKNYGKELKLDTNMDKIVIEEVLYSVTDYNYKENTFKFPLIQKAYKKINSNPEEIKVFLVLWCDCGGEGGLIVRGKNIGCDTGYTHSDSSEIEFNGKIYEYDGYLFEKHEKLHKAILSKSN